MKMKKRKGLFFIDSEFGTIYYSYFEYEKPVGYSIRHGEEGGRIRWYDDDGLLWVSYIVVIAIETRDDF